MPAVNVLLLRPSLIDEFLRRRKIYVPTVEHHRGGRPGSPWLVTRRSGRPKNMYDISSDGRLIGFKIEIIIHADYRLIPDVITQDSTFAEYESNLGNPDCMVDFLVRKLPLPADMYTVKLWP